MGENRRVCGMADILKLPNEHSHNSTEDSNILECYAMSTHFNTPEDINLQQHCCQNLKSDTALLFLTKKLVLLLQ